MEYEAVVRSYLTQLVGPDRAERSTGQVMAELAAVNDSSGGAPPDAGSVRRLVRSAGLEALDAEVRSLGRRIARTATGRRQCTAVARRLRDRADGRISAGELNSFYRHLERCQTCAGVAGRFEASEWYLQVELGSAKPRPTDSPSSPAPPARDLRPAEPGVTPTARALREPVGVPEQRTPLEPEREPGQGISLSPGSGTDAELQPDLNPAHTSDTAPARPTEPGPEPVAAHEPDRLDPEPDRDGDPEPAVVLEPAALPEPAAPLDPDPEPVAPFESGAALDPDPEPAAPPESDPEPVAPFDRDAEPLAPFESASPFDPGAEPVPPFEPAPLEPDPEPVAPFESAAPLEPDPGPMAPLEPDPEPTAPLDPNPEPAAALEPDPEPAAGLEPDPEPAAPPEPAAAAVDPDAEPASRVSDSWPDHVITPPDWAIPLPEPTPATGVDAAPAPSADAAPARPADPTPALAADPAAGGPPVQPDLFEGVSSAAAQAKPRTAGPGAGRRIDPPPGFRDRPPGESPAPEQRGPAPVPATVLSAPHQRSRSRTGIVVVTVLVILAAAGAAIWLTGLASTGSARHGAISPLEKTTAEGATPNGAAAAVPASPVIARTTDAAFVLAGASFEASANSSLPWTDFKRTVSAGPGNRWLLVDVRVRNISRVGFDPRVLHYRVTTPTGATYFPNLAYGTAPAARRPANPVPIGAVVQVELAFQVPESAAGLKLAFDPTGRHERLVVALGR
ncbi:MAG TPA: hypothetical protein VIJ51_15700 [Solirubrobacteraceae bacterium]